MIREAVIYVLADFNVVFRALPESPKPPPDPNLGNLVLFFGRQKRRFAHMTNIFLMMIMMVSMIIMMIILVILMIIMKKMTK